MEEVALAEGDGRAASQRELPNAGGCYTCMRGRPIRGRGDGRATRTFLRHTTARDHLSIPPAFAGGPDLSGRARLASLPSEPRPSGR